MVLRSINNKVLQLCNDGNERYLSVIPIKVFHEEFLL